MELNDVIAVKTHIANELTDYIGTYTFRNGANKQAISILPDKRLGMDYPPADTTIVGLECVLIMPKISHERYFDGGMLKSRVDIFLKDFGNGAVIYDAMQKLFFAVYQFHQQVTDPVYIQGNKAANIIPQASISVYFRENFVIEYLN